MHHKPRKLSVIGAMKGIQEYKIMKAQADLAPTLAEKTKTMWEYQKKALPVAQEQLETELKKSKLSLVAEERKNIVGFGNELAKLMSDAYENSTTQDEFTKYVQQGLINLKKDPAYADQVEDKDGNDTFDPADIKREDAEAVYGRALEKVRTIAKPGDMIIEEGFGGKETFRQVPFKPTTTLTLEERKELETHKAELKPEPTALTLEGKKDFEAHKNKLAKDLAEFKSDLKKLEPEDKFNKATKLRDKFSQQSKTFIEVRNAYRRVRASAKDPSAAGDLALIFNYMKILDPASVVRESEFATAANAAGIPDRIRAQYNKILRGEKMAPAQRKDFTDRTEKLYAEQVDSQKQLVAEFKRISEHYGIDAEGVIVDYMYEIAEPGELPEEAISQLKEGVITEFKNGQKWTLKNGKPARIPDAE